MMKILITGANGFIGKHVCSLFARRNVEVHAVSRGKHISVDTSILWHEIDLLHDKQVASLIQSIKPTHLMHLAWESTPGVYWRSSDNYQWVTASMNLVEHFYRNGGRRMIAAGTCAEYDWREGILSEQQTALTYSSPYAACKNRFQELLHSFSTQTGLSTAWGRVFFLYGPNESPSRLVPSVIRSLLRDEDALCTEGTQRRDYLYIEDAADALITVMDSELQGPVNIASGQAIQLNELIKKIAVKLNKLERVKLGAIQHAMHEQPLVQGDVQRLKELHWSPKYDLDKGIDFTLTWWKKTMEEGHG
ncbi:NAD-dependent epimerase/dehydratase family protein [Paenibacillus guangzhouensis]|uniref:NAD-dependent epimerase/dehydratase family protein n=1 Tax=Paenibacillus guangzhouensis TaxID=1473112 RepID=UPI0012670AEB|nr:NAD-dependent epimerase/dehydratase [Paenibacillus guangzhouensis]